MINHPNPTIGLLGGTFDPIHFGHLRAALEIQQILQLHEVRLIPCKQPVHKPGAYANSQQRLAMLELAIAATPALRIDEREIQRPTKSYMYDTLVSLRQDYPHTPLCLILGSDAFLGLPTWHRWQELLDYAHLVIAMRPGTDFNPLTELANWLQERAIQDPEDLHTQLAGNIYLQTITALDISSTIIRSQISAGYNPSYLLPETVWSYIQRHHLYQH